MEDDVVCLPHAGGTARVDERRVLRVDRRRDAVRIVALDLGIRIRIVRVEDLDLIHAHRDHARIAAELAVLARILKRAEPFDVELRVAKRLARAGQA